MKNILKIVSFGLILVILLNIMAAVFNEGLLARKRCVIYYDRRIAELSKEPEGEINVLFVGDSLCNLFDTADRDSLLFAELLVYGVR